MAIRGIAAIACIGAAAWMQGDLGDRNRDRRRNDFRYTPDPAVVKVAAGAHRSSVADAMWLQTLPDMSREFSDTKAKARWIHGAIDAITDLEPGFGTVYDFGHSYLLIIGRRDPDAVDRAIKLLEKGHRQNPKSAGMLVRLAMVHYLDRKDREKALEYLRLAAPLDDMDSLSMQMLATLEAKGRDDLVALGRWMELVDQGNEESRDNAWEKLYSIKQTIAARAVLEYEQKFGKPPQTPADLRGKDLIQEGAATEVVLDGLEFVPVPDKNGLPTGVRPNYPAAQQYTIRSYQRAWSRQARTWYSERGSWPTMEQLFETDMKLPAAPAGKRWVLEKDVLSLVDEPSR